MTPSIGWSALALSPLLQTGQTAPAATVSETRVEELTWLSPIPAWAFFLLVLPAVVAFVVYLYRRERVEHGGTLTAGSGPAAVPAAPRASLLSSVLIALRVLVILSIVILLGAPVLRATRYQNLDSSIIVLVDDSLSMDIADKYSNRELLGRIADSFRSSPETIESTKRYDLVRRLFRDRDLGLLDKLREKGKVSAYTFAGGIRRLKQVPRRQPEDQPLTDEEREILPGYDSVRAEERVRESRIADALLEVVAAERGGGLGGAEQPIAGILLFSDGQQTPGARSLQDIGRRLGQRSIPVYALGVGNPDEPKDIRLLSLEVNDIVLAGDKVPFDIVLAADGFDGERVRIDLKFDDEIVDTEFAVLEGGGRRQSVRLEHRPAKPGDFVGTVEVERLSGELFAENNAVSKPIKVLDQKIRVLYADGPPRWEYRYLKNALIRDPTMEAQVYLFSADPTFIQESSPGVPPLAAFPEGRQELFNYHVVVLGDVDVKKSDADRGLSADQVTLLKDFVYEAGGGIVFIAGDNANPGRYLHTDLYSVLPVEVAEQGKLPGIAEPVTSSFNVELTPVGREHTVLRLDNDLERNLKLWENKDGLELEHLPGFYWFSEVRRAKKGTVVLARHPGKVDPVEQKGYVIFAFMNYGKGRTFFSAVDNTWRWRAGVDNQYFYRFWGQVIRFCATGRLLGRTPRFSISTDKLSYTLGENISIVCRVFDAEMKPSTEKSLTVYHQYRGAEGSEPEALELELDPVQGQGTYHGGMVAGRIGLHDLWIGTESERLAFQTFEVAVPALEFKDPRRNQALLEEVARLSGGAYLDFQDAARAVEKLEGQSRSQAGDVSDDPLWDDSWVLFLFTGLIALEWILRKVANLL